MNLKPFVNVKCPCCNEVLEVDVARQRVVAHRKGLHTSDDRRDGEDGLDVAFRNAQVAEERSKADFISAQDKLKNQSARLDQLFRDAQKKVAETPPSPDDPPIKPRWD